MKSSLKTITFFFTKRRVKNFDEDLGHFRLQRERERERGGCRREGEIVGCGANRNKKINKMKRIDIFTKILKFR